MRFWAVDLAPLRITGPGGRLAYARQGHLDLNDGAIEMWVAPRADGGTRSTPTDRPLSDLCSRDMGGLLASDTQLVHCSVE